MWLIKNMQKGIATIVFVLLSVFLVAQTNVQNEGHLKKLIKLANLYRYSELYYTTNTSLQSFPFLEAVDTANFNSICYKTAHKLYIKNGEDETFLEDSILVRIVNRRKKIWIDKINAKQKEEMLNTDITNRQLQKLITEKYVTTETKIDKNINEISLMRWIDDTLKTSNVEYAIAIMYNTETEALLSFKMISNLKQPFTPEVEQYILKKGINANDFIISEGNYKFLNRKQILTTNFLNIQTKNINQIKVPMLSERLQLNKQSNEYEGLGDLLNFEIIKSF
jgi:hypothetical protein